MRKKKKTSVGMNPQHLDLITVALLTELKARQEQIVSNYGGNCGTVNVKSTRFQACSDSSNMKQLIDIQINPSYLIPIVALIFIVNPNYNYIIILF